MPDPTPFGSYVDRYVSAGWIGVLPLPAREKKSPPTGYTGDAGEYPDVVALDDWRASRAAGNIGLRMAADVIGIDVDAYGDKPGAETFARLAVELGALPDTWCSTSRDDGISGIRFYRLAQPLKLIGSLPGIEIIQRHHRYAVVAPSIHPEGGREYRWIGPGGEVGDLVPEVDELPYLPDAWVEHLRADKRSTRDRQTLATGLEVAPAVERAYGAAMMGMTKGTRHDSTLRAVTALLRLERQEFPGATQAIRDLERAFLSAITADGTRSDREAQGEWDRMVESAGDEVASTPSIVPKWEPMAPAPDAEALGLTNLNPAPMPDDPWPAPIPLGSLAELPPFPAHVLPSWMADFAWEVADDLQVPVDLPATLGLGALSTLAAGRLKVKVRGRWVEHVNIYTVVALPPSMGKSPAFKAMCGPVRTLEAEYQRMTRADVAANADMVDVLEAELKRAKQLADVSRETLAEIRERLATAQEAPTTPPKLTVGDATPEALAKLLSDNGGRIAVHSTEGGVFDLMTGRYSDRANLDVYLQGWSGDPLDTARIGREANVAEEALLTMVLTVQPSVIAALAERPELAGRGLTARFMYSVPPDVLGHRDLSLRPEGDAMAKLTYESMLTEFGRRMLAWQHPAEVRLGDEALQHYTDWRQGLEERRTADGDLRPMAEWTGKLESTVLRVAGLLHLANGHDIAAPVTLATMTQSLTLGEYWLAHAAHVHDLWGASSEMIDARAVLEWAERIGAQDFTVRDLYGANRARFKRADDTLPALTLLAERGWLRTSDGGPIATQRNKRSVLMVLHPEFSTVSARSARSALKDVKRVLSLSLEEGLEKGTPAQNAQNAQNLWTTEAPSEPPPSPSDPTPTDWMDL